MRGAKKFSINRHLFVVLLVLVTCSCFVLQNLILVKKEPTLAASWYDYSWSHRTVITVDDAKVDADLNNFPVLISSTNADWADIDHGGKVAQSDGGDIIFTDSSNAIKFAHEIEKYDNTTGQLIAWVNVNALADSTDTVINMYYGNASVVDQWNAAGVWDTNNTFVYHLNEDSGTLHDSTSGDYDLTSNNTTSSAGKIGNGVTYDKASSQRAYLEWAGNAAIPANLKNAASDSLTFSGWVKTVNTGAAENLLLSDSSWTTIFAVAKNANNTLMVTLRGNWEICGIRGNVTGQITTATTYGDNAWHYIAVVMDRTIGNGAVKLYVDGQLINTSASFSSSWEGFQWTDTSNTPGISIGAYNDGATTYYTGGTDEFRYSKSIGRSAQWISTEYNNQNSPATFYSLGETQQGDTTSPANPDTITGYDTSSKTTQIASDGWANYLQPYFEFNGASDPESGVKGYYIYWGDDPTADPYSLGTYQSHSGSNSALQTFIPSASSVNDTTYYLRIGTENNATENNHSSPATLFVYKFENLPPEPPEYINVSPAGCSTAARFNFSWPEASDADSQLATYQYRLGSTGEIKDNAAVTLDAMPYQDGDNILYLRSKDNAGNVSSWQTVVFCSTGAVHIVDGPTVQAGPSSLTTSWVSTKPTTSSVRVYEGNTYISEQGQTSYSYNHSVKVIGLEPEREYRYQIAWSDQSGNIGESDWYTTNTAQAPQINNLKVDVLSTSQINVSWMSSIQARTIIEYGITSYDKQITLDALSSGSSNKIADLEPGSRYMLRVSATGTDGTKFFAGQSFDMPPLPQASEIRYEPITDLPQSALKVTWKTNVLTSSSIFYGVKNADKKELTKSEMKLEHELRLEQLSDNSQYEIYVAGVDSYGNQFKSSVGSITTEYDSRPAQISSVVIESSNVGLDKQDKAQIAISWKTDEPTTSQIEYAEGISGSEYTNVTTEDKTLTTNHLVIIPNLTPSAPYHIRISVTDRGGNLSKSEDHTVIPGDVPKSALQIILATFQRIFGWLGL